eukprot:CAMPEP_0194077244 /NCGR_PEP_ID=MMETSP0149-20130528/3886_1 /TAXON_ID=122233 /ORGANISM="Chaetoceros debilis, Strain MM31A-1" /LENGTH=579 /DNA_ID=CAMNT_0038758193 /DNA_START=130 /DNA_END=1869 /DNA_ORIENTATION=-
MPSFISKAALVSFLAISAQLPGIFVDGFVASAPKGTFSPLSSSSFGVRRNSNSPQKLSLRASPSTEGEYGKFDHSKNKECDKHIIDMDMDIRLKSMFHKCKSVSAALVTASALFLSPMNNNLEQNIPNGISNSNDVNIEQINSGYPSSLDHNIFNFIRNQPVYAAGLDTSKAEILTKQQHATVLDEVWTLVDKYYLDNTYNSQNWNAMRDQYEAKLAITTDDKGSYDDDEAMAIANTMVKSLGDKYSRILDRAGYTRIQKFDLIGVGATLMPDADKRIMVGAPPVQGSESELGGIKYGDYIVAVNGIPTAGRTAFQIIDQLGENPNAESVSMTVLTQGTDDAKGEGYTREVNMKRSFQKVKDPIEYKITERRKDGKVVGYVRIAEFNSLVKPKLEAALKSLKADGANSYVMDLRYNPGGAFQSAVEIAGLFMDDKIATNVVDSNAVEMPFRTTVGKTLIDESSPLVIWLDGGSASASEVLAGALHDQCRGVVMGTDSFGKGLIQAVYGLKNGTGLVLTVAKYETPNGTNIQGTGIKPDIATKLPPLLIPGLSSDTSKVDFNDVSKRLGACTCPIETGGQ